MAPIFPSQMALITDKGEEHSLIVRATHGCCYMAHNLQEYVDKNLYPS